MLQRENLKSAARRAAPIAAVAVLVAGCASASKTNTASMPSTGGATKQSSTTGMAGMAMGTSSTNASAAAAAEMSVAGIKPVPTQILGTADWEGMQIAAQAMTAVPFVVYNGTSERIVKPGPHTSFHLMVMLNDSQTGVAIPYASVWATITKTSKVVFDERQWPMLSRYMGPHYGNDVTLPGAGNYTLSLLISPPVSARHVEYQNVWLKPHRVSFSFHWKPVS
jgi:uncharacterized protein involved in high-affinity Fe2+ transport